MHACMPAPEMRNARGEGMSEDWPHMSSGLGLGLGLVLRLGLGFGLVFGSGLG